jgi:hypothetical protein
LKDFPDLQENVINAVYDLCEDSDSEVRLSTTCICALALKES